MSEPAASGNPWKTLDRIARTNLVLGFFIGSRLFFELIQRETQDWHRSQFYTVTLTLDLLMAILSLLSGGLLLRHHPKGLLISAIAGGAIYSNALFGLWQSFPEFFHSLPKVRASGDRAVASASLASHFVQSAVLMLYWTGALLILLGDLKKRRLEEIYESHSRPAVLTCFATAASSVAALQVLLRLFG